MTHTAHNQRGEIFTVLTFIAVGVMVIGSIIGSWVIKQGPLKNSTFSYPSSGGGEEPTETPVPTTETPEPTPVECPNSDCYTDCRVCNGGGIQQCRNECREESEPRETPVPVENTPVPAEGEPPAPTSTPAPPIGGGETSPTPTAEEVSPTPRSAETPEPTRRPSFIRVRIRVENPGNRVLVRNQYAFYPEGGLKQNGNLPAGWDTGRTVTLTFTTWPGADSVPIYDGEIGQFAVQVRYEDEHGDLGYVQEDALVEAGSRSTMITVSIPPPPPTPIPTATLEPTPTLTPIPTSTPIPPTPIPTVTQYRGINTELNVVPGTSSYNRITVDLLPPSPDQYRYERTVSPYYTHRYRIAFPEPNSTESPLDQDDYTLVTRVWDSSGNIIGEDSRPAHVGSVVQYSVLLQSTPPSSAVTGDVDGRITINSSGRRYDSFIVDLENLRNTSEHYQREFPISQSNNPVDTYYYVLENIPLNRDYLVTIDVRNEGRSVTGVERFQRAITQGTQYNFSLTLPPLNTIEGEIQIQPSRNAATGETSRFDTVLVQLFTVLDGQLAYEHEYSGPAGSRRQGYTLNMPSLPQAIYNARISVFFGGRDGQRLITQDAEVRTRRRNVITINLPTPGTTPTAQNQSLAVAAWQVDVNNDGVISADDLATVKANYFQTIETDKGKVRADALTVSEIIDNLK